MHVGASAELALSTGVLRLSGDGPFTGAGGVSASTGHWTEAYGASTQTWTKFNGSLGSLRVSNTSAGGLTLSTAAGSSFSLTGGLTVDPAAVLRASSTALSVGGNWSAAGSVYLGRSTVTFASAVGSTVSILAGGGAFDYMAVNMQSGKVVFSTAIIAASTLTVASGTLDLSAASVTVRGAWIETGGTVLGGTSRVVFDGVLAQTVVQRSSSSFGAFISSSATGVTIASGLSTTRELEWHRGALSFPGRALTIRGDMLNKSGGVPAAIGSTVTFAAVSTQSVSFSVLDSVVIDNADPAGVRLIVNASWGNFRINAGRTFDGTARALNIAGDSWSTVGANYLSVPQQHSVSWTPTSTITVVSGSVVNAKLTLATGKIAALQGSLLVDGPGNGFIPQQGAVVLNAAGGSTITFRGSDLVPASGANWFYAGNAADSWLVFQGTGLARGAAISTNTFGNVLVSLSSPTEVFRVPDLNVSGSLILADGTLRPQGARTISVGGNLIQTGGAIDFGAASTGTVRLTGASTQILSLLPATTLWNLIASGTGTVSAASSLAIRGDFTVNAGQFLAGASTHSIAGHIRISSAAAFQGQSSTVTLNGAYFAYPYQTVSFLGGGSFHGLSVEVSSAAFLTSATVQTLTDALAGSTIAVAGGATLRVDDLHIGGSSGAWQRLASMNSGVPWFLNVVGVSSVTRTMVSDCDASGGLTVNADDGTNVNAGGNVNWDFTPQLLILLPGETFTPGVSPGKTGIPEISTAGVAITVGVQVVSSRFEPVTTAVATVTLTSDDAGAVIDAPHPLVQGATSFTMIARTAEPSPRATMLTASTPFATSTATLSVNPNSLVRLQVLVTGESAWPGSVSGKNGSASARVRGVPFTATVRAVDAFWNLISTAADTVALSMSASSASLPAAAALAGGQRVFSGIVSYSTGLFTLSATDVTNPGVISGTSAVFGVSPPSASTPILGGYVPNSSRVATLGGGVSGFATDDSSVERVLVDLRDIEAGLHFNWTTQSFLSGSPVFTTATLGAPLAPGTTWFRAAVDAAFTDGHHILLTARVENPSGLQIQVTSTFTFDRGMLAFGAKDGQGTAGVLPASAPGCTEIISTVTLTVGAAGIGQGGAVSVRPPEGWSLPLGATSQYPPPSDYWHVPSTSGASVSAGWLTLSVATNAAQTYAAGQRIVLTYRGRPPFGPSGRGEQSFSVMTRGDGSGTLLAISSAPVMTLLAGTTHFLAFADPSPLSLTRLTASATMQLVVTDLCGNPALGLSSGTVGLSLSAQTAGALVKDASAEFFNAFSTPISSIYLSTGLAAGASPSFSIRTSTDAPAELVLRATATFSGSTFAPIFVEAVRAVRLRATAPSFGAVSVDTGTPVPGATSATLSAADPGASAAYIRFTLSDSELTWRAIVSADPVAFSSPVFTATGPGDPARPVALSWDGTDRSQFPPRYAPPGRYAVRLLAGGGALDDRSLEIVVPPTAGYAGRLGARGAGAQVRAGAGDGRWAVASSTGYFELRGLKAGQPYALSVTTEVVVLGRLLTLSTAVAVAAAADPLKDVGTLALPATAYLRVALLAPVPSPRDALGGFIGRAPDGTAVFSGTLRLSSGAASSDDGGPLFGRSASTWSVVSALPGVYDLDVDVPDLRLSTRIAGVTVPAGGGADLVLPFEKKANVFGFVVLPSTVSFGTWATVSARRFGDAEPSVYGGVFVSSIPPLSGPSSGAYALYGLDPGSWTVVARAPGFTTSSTTILIIGGADVSLNLAPGLGARITGSVSAIGDTRQAAQCFPSSGGAPASCPAGSYEVEVEALAVGRLDRAAARVRLGTDASLSSATFAITGLDAGDYVLRTFLPGFGLQPPQGATATVTAGGSAAAALTLSKLDARLRLEIALPPLAGGACRSTTSYRSLGLSLEPEGSAPIVFGDATAMAPTPSSSRTQYSSVTGAFLIMNCSSVTAFSPALPPGPVRASALFAPTGGLARARAALADGTTAALTLDLSGSTFAVTGAVSFSGQLAFSARTNAAEAVTVAVSSVAGVLMQAPNVSFCLLGSGDPLASSALRAELLPYDETPAQLRRATGTASGLCAAPATSTAPAASVAYVAQVAADGRFSFAGVSPGLYWLRVPGEFDDNPDNGPEVSEARTLVSVSTSAASASLQLTRGRRVSGSVSAPAGLAAGRPLRVALYDETGTEVRSVDIPCGFAGTAYTIDGVPDGRYRLSVTDLGEPTAWTARPAAVVVAGSDVDGRDAALTAAATIRARLSLVRTSSDGSEETVLVSRDNAFLLPPGFSARAVPVPYADFGVFEARAAADGSIVDSEGRVTISGLLPGTYDVEFAAPASAAPGAMVFAPARLSGVIVGAGQAADLGVVPLFSGAAVSGSLTAAGTGLPLEGVRVSARPTLRAAGLASATAVTDAAGRYLLRGLNPSLRWYDITAAPRDAADSGDPVPPYESKRVVSVDVSSGAVLDFALAPAAGAVIGRVVSGDGLPLVCALGAGAAQAPGAALFLQRSGVPPADDPLADLAMRSGPDGRFTIASLSTGTYVLTVTAVGQANLTRTVILSTALADLGVLTLGGGGAVAGSLRLPDGSAVPDSEARAVAAVTPDLSEFIYGALTRDTSARSVSGYKIGGLRAGRSYRLLVLTEGDEATAPDEAAAVVLTSSAEVRALDLVVRPPAPTVTARAYKTETRFRVDFLFSRPLRARLPIDDVASRIVSTVSATGTLSGWRLSEDRRKVSVDYDPGVGESSFTLRARAPAAGLDYDAADPSARELIASATASFFIGETGTHRAVVANALGGSLLVEGDAGRVSLPRGAFLVGSSSAVVVTLRRAPTALGTAGLPGTLRAAAAALPAGLPARSDFYEIELPAGVPSTLARPARLTLVYSSAVADPSTLNVYWYNPGSGQFVLQPDAFGGRPALNSTARSLSLSVGHFSTFVLLASAAGAIGGSAYSGELDAYNFPNPFDLQVKTVTTIHGAGVQSVRGTMVRVSVPRDLSGEAKFRIYDVLGGLVRTIDLGTLAGGQTYYSGWDGRNDGGADVASGVYIGQVVVGSKRKSFKMAVIK